MPRNALTALLFAGLLLAACGVKTDLDPPPSATITNAEGEQVQAPRPDRRFILDPLL